MLKGKERLKQANSFKFDRRILKEKQEKIKKQQKINKLISNVISEQSQMETGNGTILGVVKMPFFKYCIGAKQKMNRHYEYFFRLSYFLLLFHDQSI